VSPSQPLATGTWRTCRHTRAVCVASHITAPRLHLALLHLWQACCMLACTHVLLQLRPQAAAKAVNSSLRTCVACTPAVLPLHINGNFLGDEASATYSVFMKFTMANMEIGDAKMWWGAAQAGFCMAGCLWIVPAW
jgi:hypothetical protein